MKFTCFSQSPGQNHPFRRHNPLLSPQPHSISLRSNSIPSRKVMFVKKLLAVALFAALISAPKLVAQDPLDGLWQGYDGEWRHVSNQLIALAEATPADKFAWRPAPGVRSTSEVYMHIVLANFWLLSATGPKMPPDLKQELEKTVTSKPEVIAWLKRSLEAVKQAHLAADPKDMSRKLKVEGRDATVDGMYLRIIVHANEHMGQLVAYSRMNGVAPPWSK
jgi:uncharacterized damage-inducible protein DinB